MSTATPTKPTRGKTGSRWNPNKVRRRIVPDRHAPHGFGGFKIKSLTTAGADAPVWHPTIDPQTGAVSCDCPDFLYRGRRKGTCKHCDRMLQLLQRGGERFPIAQQPAALVPVQICHICGDPGACYELADERGEPVVVYLRDGSRRAALICAECARGDAQYCHEGEEEGSDASY